MCVVDDQTILITAKEELRLDFMQEILKQELSFCQRVNKYHPRNYYQWTYRTKLVKDILIPLIRKCPSFQETTLNNEILELRKYLKQNPKDQSARYYLNQI